MSSKGSGRKPPKKPAPAAAVGFNDAQPDDYLDTGIAGDADEGFVSQDLIRAQQEISLSFIMPGPGFTAIYKLMCEDRLDIFADTPCILRQRGQDAIVGYPCTVRMMQLQDVTPLQIISGGYTPQIFSNFVDKRRIPPDEIIMIVEFDPRRHALIKNFNVPGKQLVVINPTYHPSIN